MNNKKNLRRYSILFSILIALFINGCAKENVEKEEAINPPMLQNGSLATFAGGCFWCMEAPFETLDGVSEVISGYAGGTEEEATYKKVSSGETDHREAVQIMYDPKKIEYATLLETFFGQIDPTDSGGQFSDRGFHYTTAIYYHDETQKEEAEEVIDKLEKEKKFERPIITVVEPYTTFFMAEEYHQDFYKKSYEHYEAYKKASGRGEFISENWAKEAALEYSRENEEICLSYKCFKKPSKTTLKETLTDLQYDVTQEDGTERAYENEYWNLKEEGIYVDIVSGEPLFSSTDKYDSETGWPSFTKPISEDSIVKKTDHELFYPRTEVRSKIADSHLGHLFDDGPEELGGQRWCINSAALKFIPKDELIGDYEEFKNLFL